jgi:peptidoglycan/xylan/chitin deacetylase (PgdA/CDA1 family)
MYHELAVPGRPLAAAEAGYALYCVPRDAFRAHLRALADAGLRGAALGEARARRDARTVAITFDDGCETDALEAAPALRERGFGATFFVIAGLVERRGYLRGAQLRELSAAGFEIGSHSSRHLPLTALDPGELHEELTGSRRALEDATGAPVRHLSCPHGRWSAAVAAAARAAGYETVSTSETGLNGPATPAARLRRIAVRRDVPAQAVAAFARGADLRGMIARDAVVRAGRRLLGEERYAAARERLVRFTHGP